MDLVFTLHPNAKIQTPKSPTPPQPHSYLRPLPLRTRTLPLRHQRLVIRPMETTKFLYKQYHQFISSHTLHSIQGGPLHPKSLRRLAVPQLEMYICYH